MNKTGTSLMIGYLALCLGASTPGCAAHRAKREAAAGKPAPKLSHEEVAKYQNPIAVTEFRESAVEMLVKLAGDPNPQIRCNAIEGLSETPARLEPLLPHALADPNPGVRSTAALMAGKTEMRSVIAAIRPLLQDQSPFAQASAIYALSKCGQHVEMTPLADLLLTNPSPRVRSHAAFLLGELGEPSAAGLLRDAVKAPLSKAAPSEVRLLQIQIAEALVKLGDESQLEVIRAALYPSRPEDLEVAALAVQVIGEVKDRGAIDNLIYLTAYKDKQGGQMPAEIRLGAAGSLARMGMDQGTFIADEYVKSPIPILRAQAALVYGQIGRTENLPRLEKLMEDPDPVTRVSAAVGALKAGTILAQQPEGR
jgi:HEAT repeat protein